MTTRLMWVAAVLAAVAAAAGLVVRGLYRDAPFWADQARGTDIATLFLAVPILVGGLVAARRGSTIARLASIAALLYLVYNYAIFSFSVAMNPLTPAYIAILGLAVWSLFLALSELDLDRAAAAVERRVRRRSSGAALIVVAAVFALLWLGQIASATATGVLPPDLVRAELPTNPIYALDLGLFLPLCVVAGVALLRRTPLAAFALPMLIWLFLTSVGVFAGFVIPALRGEAFAVVPAAVVGSIGAVVGVLATLVLRPVDKERELTRARNGRLARFRDETAEAG
ncbi:MAG: hypothetical protein ACJ77B_04770 [Chloroflexota bacterium]